MRAQQKNEWLIGIQKVALACEAWMRCKVSVGEAGEMVPVGQPLLVQLADLDWTLDELLECREGCKLWQQWQSLARRAAERKVLPMLWLQQRRGPFLIMMPNRIEHDVRRMHWRFSSPAELGLGDVQLVSWVWLEGVDPQTLLAQAVDR